MKEETEEIYFKPTVLESYLTREISEITLIEGHSTFILFRLGLILFIHLYSNLTFSWQVNVVKKSVAKGVR